MQILLKLAEILTFTNQAYLRKIYEWSHDNLTMLVSPCQLALTSLFLTKGRFSSFEDNLCSNVPLKYQLQR